MTFETISKAFLTQIDRGIRELLPNEDERPSKLHGAMHYSLAQGGKRLRPMLVLAAAELGEAQAGALPAAIAVECLHTYSLIHDDLPGIDNSDLRRGRPSCHKQYDEATAILAGDALLTDAFRILAEGYPAHPSLALRLIQTLSRASSSRELIGGQMEDILGESRELSSEDLDYIHRHKTASLLSACLEMGLLHTAPSPGDLVRIRNVGQTLGLAFQIVDDILDATSSEATLGKSAGRDAALQKSTYVRVHGLETSRRRVTELTAEATRQLGSWGDRAAFLTDLVKQLAHRIK